MSRPTGRGVPVTSKSMTASPSARNISASARSSVTSRFGAGPADVAPAGAPSSASPTSELSRNARIARRVSVMPSRVKATARSIHSIAFNVAGVPRRVGAEAALTAYRTAQEALTNARKHAPGQPVALGLTFTADELAVEVVNGLPADAGTGPLARAGAGYGLTGLRERAALAGGTLAAGPDGGRWRVCLRIPV